MAAGEEIDFEPAFAEMLAENLHDAAIFAEVGIDIFDRRHPFLA